MNTKYIEETKYILMHKEKALIRFSLSKGDVTEAIINKRNIKYLPLPLKRIIHFKGQYILKETEQNLILNEEGAYLVEEWLFDRSIPVTREGLYNYYDRGTRRLDYLLTNHSISLVDCYWTKGIIENISWIDINPYNAYHLSKLGSKAKVEENLRNNIKYNSYFHSVLQGYLEKFWCFDNKQLNLVKKTPYRVNILNIREIIANKIYEKQGFNNYCQYKYIRNSSKQIVGVKCKAFTSENIELITAYDILEEFNETQHPDIYNNIIKRASAYGANPYEVSKQLDIQTLVDYLITNRDRHQNNIGFLRNSNSLQIIGMAPIFDSGSSKYLEGEKPEGVTNTTVHNLYNTELECLYNIKNIKALDLSKLPSNQWILTELRKAENLSKHRIQFMYDLYKSKVKYLKELQNQD